MTKQIILFIFILLISINIEGQENNIDLIIKNSISLTKNEDNEYVLKFKDAEIGIVRNNIKGIFLHLNSADLQLDSNKKLISYTKNSLLIKHNLIEKNITLSDGTLKEVELRLLDYKDTSLYNFDSFSENIRKLKNIKDTIFRISGYRVEQVFHKEERSILCRTNSETGIPERVFAINERIPYNIYITIKFDLKTNEPNLVKVFLTDSTKQEKEILDKLIIKREFGVFSIDF